MKTLATILLAAALMACGGSPRTPSAPVAETPAPQGLQIKLTTIYVDDQDKALAFYTGVLGFEEKDDISNGGYRWLTVMAPGDDDGVALQLALADTNPAAKAFQQASFEAGEPAAMFFTDDIERDHERMTAAGAEVTMPPTEVTAGSVITMVKDGVGNLIQITELAQ
jgi:predicted enzyme related to lactoylglutathione lyase